MSAFKAPEHTQVPNSFFDMMADMSEVELRVTLCAIRKTFGWHKRQDEISLTQFQDMTGLSRQGVLNGIEASETRGTIRKAGAGKRNTTIFELCVIEEKPEPQPENVVSLDQSTQLTTTSQHSRPELVNTVDTQKKGNKIKEKELSPAIAEATEKPISEKLTSDDHTEYMSILNGQFKLHGGRAWDVLHQLRGTTSEKKKHTKRYEYGQLFRDKPVELSELKTFPAWYRTQCEDCDLPISAETIEDWFGKYRAVKQKPIIDRRLQARKLPVNLDMLTGEQSA